MGESVTREKEKRLIANLARIDSVKLPNDPKDPVLNEFYAIRYRLNSASRLPEYLPPRTLEKITVLQTFSLWTDVDTLKLAFGKHCTDPRTLYEVRLGNCLPELVQIEKIPNPVYEKEVAKMAEARALHESLNPRLYELSKLILKRKEFKSK